MQRPTEILYRDSGERFHAWKITKRWQVILVGIDGRVSEIGAGVGLTSS
jgi:hypothetical protein